MKQKISESKARWLLLAGIIVLAIVIFRDVLPSQQVLFSTDNNIGNEKYTKDLLPSGFASYWSDYPLLGGGGVTSLNWTQLLLMILPATVYVDWIHAIDLIFASLFLVLFLRLKGVIWPACGVASLSAYWLGSNFTLTYAGHNGKFAVLMFAAAALWLIEKTAMTRKIPWAMLAGSAVGMMFMEQPDVALFFGLFLGPYALYALIRENGRSPLILIKAILPMLIMAGVLAGPPSLRVYLFSTEGKSPASSEDPVAKAQEQWNFSTQWSWPPEETIAFVAPGYTGWRSGEPKGPYWGRMGRSPGWSKESPQGFRNFKLENTYLGAIPVFFALIAVFAAYGGFMERDRKRDVVFLFIATLVVFFLSFGKYFPLYRAFYALPGISSIRNPNKFLQVFQVLLSILSAYGVHALFAGSLRAVHSSKRKRMLIASGVLGAISIFLLLGGMTASVGRASRISRFVSEGWGASSPVIVDTMIRALFHGGVLALFSAVVIALFSLTKIGGNKKASMVASWAIVGVVAFDALLLSNHYIHAMDMKTNVDRNVAVEYLLQEGRHNRFYATPDGPFYNNWLTVLFPYYGVNAFNVTQMPRMPEDYSRFLGALGGNSLRLWQIAAVKNIMMPVQSYAQIHNDENMRALFEPAAGFNVAQVEGGLKVTQSPQGATPQHVIARYKSAFPRYSMFYDWQVASDDEALRKLADMSFDAAKTLLVSDDQEFVKSSPDSSRDLSDGGQAQIKHYGRKKVNIKVVTDAPGVLLSVTKFDPGWKVFVNGEEQPLLRCNYLCQGVYLKAGISDVIFKFTSNTTHLWIQLVGFLAMFGAIGILIRGRRS